MQHTTKFYIGLVAVIVVMNCTTTETLSEVEMPEPIMTVDKIPLDYVTAHFPNGRIPDEVRNSHVRAFVLQATRGWPGWFQNDFGYHYTLVNPATNTITEIRGFPHAEKTPWLQRIRWNTLFGNTFGLLVCVGLLHLSTVLFARSIRRTAGLVPPNTAIAGER